MNSQLTLAGLGTLIGMIISAAAGTWYVQTAIADEGRRMRVYAAEVADSHREASAERIQAHAAQAADTYFRRDRAAVLETKMDTVLEILRRLERLERQRVHATPPR